MIMKKMTLLITMMLLGIFVSAQVTITGKVTDASSGEPLPGVSVSVKDFKSAGALTNEQGVFSLALPEGGKTLIFSFFGMQTKEVEIGGQTEINVGMEAADIVVDDVVVTALGISRQKKSLGYAVQDVKGDEISETNPVNVVSALTGKVSGAEIVTSSGQVGASSTIKIRGNKSFTGSTQPLFIVDGTPIMNSITTSNSTSTYTDFGNAAMDIDPSNIESISVLKGASASALYGSRAANGVVIITTKKGLAQQGIGVEFSTSFAFDNVYILPNYQNEYGQGRNGDEYEWKTNYPGYATYQEFHDAREFSWGLDGSGYRMDWDESWGSRLDVGLMVRQFNSPLNPDGSVIPTPWVSNPDNVKNFFETGTTTTNNISLSGGNEKTSARLTIGHSYQKGTSPNTDQTKINIGLNSMFKLTEKFSVTANMNYVQLSNDNIPQQGNSMRNPLTEFNSWFGRQVDMNYLKERYNDIVYYADYDQYMAFNWMLDYSDQHANPYWISYKNTMSRDRNRVFGNVSFNYKLLEGIELMARIGTDFFNEHRKYLFHKYSRDWSDPYINATNGTFWEQYRLESETNADLMVTINKHLTPDISLFATLGGNYRMAYDQYATTTGTNLVVADFFSTSNFEGEPIVDFTKYKRVTNSVFGSANVGYKNFLYLDLTLRGDWSSTLPEENWNFWYPSANLGFIFTEAFNVESSIFTYGKLRAGYAVVGNGTSPYQLRPNYYSIGTTFNGINMYGVSSVLPSVDLKPEKTNSLEFGAELKFFNNRLGIDFTYYKATTYNQLMQVAVPYSSGYSSWMKNAGSIENKGYEIQLAGSPLEKSDNLKWDVLINWSTNKNKVVELEDGLEQLQIASIYSLYGVYLMAFPGEEWGAIYGRTMLRNDAGQVLIGSNGLPIRNTASEILGNVNPDWVGGIRNTFSYKSLTFSALIDFRAGGDVFSWTKAVGQHAGILEVTVKDGIRETGIIYDGVYNQGVSIGGVDVSGQPNQTRIAARTFWRTSRNFSELSIIDGSYVKLREISFSYALPKNLISKIKLQSASLSLYGRNLALLYTHKSNDVHIDPEVSAGGTIDGTGVESYQVPATRTFGIKLDLKF